MTKRYYETRGLTALDVVAILATIIVVAAMLLTTLQKSRDKIARNNVPQAIRQGDLKMLDRALETRTDPNHSFVEDWTNTDGTVSTMNYSLLSYAVRWDQVELARTLIDHGADVNGKGWRNSRQPLYWAAYNANDAIFQMLIDAGADIHFVVKGKTALAHANETNEKAAAFLKAHGAEH